MQKEIEIKVKNNGEVVEDKKIEDSYAFFGNVYDKTTRRPLEGFKIELHSSVGILKPVTGLIKTISGKKRR